MIKQSCKLTVRQRNCSSRTYTSMKFINTLFVFICIATLYSCKSSKNAIYETNLQKEFNQYLLEITKDTNSFDLPALKVTNNNILPLLDSVISSAEKCKYFDNRLKYQHAFLIRYNKLHNGLEKYTIDAHKSIQDVIGLTANRLIRGLNAPTDVGVFYYKNYLFSSILTKNDSINAFKYPFLSKTGCTYRVHSTRLFSENYYSSYIGFIIETDHFKMTENEVCGPIILIK